MALRFSIASFDTPSPYGWKSPLADVCPLKTLFYPMEKLLLAMLPLFFAYSGCHFYFSASSALLFSMWLAIPLSKPREKWEAFTSRALLLRASIVKYSPAWVGASYPFEGPYFFLVPDPGFGLRPDSALDEATSCATFRYIFIFLTEINFTFFSIHILFNGVLGFWGFGV